MNRDELLALWAVIKSHLQKARATLPMTASNDRTIREYQDFIEHNELELACEALEEFANEHPVRPDFWVSLGDAAEAMTMHDRAKLYRARSVGK